MPNYEYKCEPCGTSEEHHRKVDDRDNFPECQYCTVVMKRIINPAPIRFNGSGFYSTGG